MLCYVMLALKFMIAAVWLFVCFSERQTVFLVSLALEEKKQQLERLQLKRFILNVILVNGSEGVLYI